jgi:hypothetical protein
VLKSASPTRNKSFFLTNGYKREDKKNSEPGTLVGVDPVEALHVHIVTAGLSEVIF